MEADPFAKRVYAFTNRRRDRVRLLYWDRNGFALWLKRLEKDRFPWPDRGEDHDRRRSPRDRLATRRHRLLPPSSSRGNFLRVHLVTLVTREAVSKIRVVMDAAEQLPDTVEALRVLLLRRNDELEARDALSSKRAMPRSHSCASTYDCSATSGSAARAKRSPRISSRSSTKQSGRWPRLPRGRGTRSRFPRTRARRGADVLSRSHSPASRWFTIFPMRRRSARETAPASWRSGVRRASSWRSSRPSSAGCGTSDPSTGAPPARGREGGPGAAPADPEEHRLAGAAGPCGHPEVRGRDAAVPPGGGFEADRGRAAALDPGLLDGEGRAPWPNP